MNNAKIQELEAMGQWDEIASLFSQAAARLRAGGAQAILFCANTRRADPPHWGRYGSGRPNQWSQEGRSNQNKYTMADGFMVDWLKEHCGIET
jgi:hypothetical protein